MEGITQEKHKVVPFHYVLSFEKIVKYQNLPNNIKRFLIKVFENVKMKILRDV